MKRGVSHKKKNIFKIFYSKLFFFLLILIFSGIVKIGFDKFKEWNFARNALIVEEEKINEEKERKDNLKNVLDSLQDERYFIRIIKEKLNLASPGEKVVIVIPEKEEVSQEENGQEEEGFFEKILQKLRDLFEIK